MPGRNISLTAEMNEFVSSKIESGRYANATDVLRAGLRALDTIEREDELKIAALRAAVQAGEESGIAKGDVMAEVRERMRRRALALGVV